MFHPTLLQTTIYLGVGLLLALITIRAIGRNQGDDPDLRDFFMMGLGLLVVILLWPILVVCAVLIAIGVGVYYAGGQPRPAPQLPPQEGRELPRRPPGAPRGKLPPGATS